MAEQKEDFSVQVNYTGGSQETLVWDSNVLVSGKIVSVTIDLQNTIRNTSSFMLKNEVKMISNQKDIFDEVKYVQGQKIEISPVRKVILGSKLGSSFQIKVKSGTNLNGTISGTISVTTTDEQDEKSSVALDQNAVSDWLKDLSVSNMKTGVQETDQYPIHFEFKQGNSQVLIWTNKGVSTDITDEIMISLTLIAKNNASAQRVLDVNFKAAYGSSEYTAPVGEGMWILSAGQTRTINTAATFTKSSFPNDGAVLITVIATNTEDISCDVQGVVILKTTSVGGGETGDVTSDSDIQSILDSLFDEGYQVGGSNSGSGIDVDAFMSAYSGAGYEDDTSLIQADLYKTMGMSDDMAQHIQQLESRITALENKMTQLEVGGSGVEWYDGGYDGTDNSWGIGEWYKQSENRTNQTEEKTDVRLDLYRDRTNLNNFFYLYNETGKSIQAVNYSIMVSYKYTGEECIGKKLVLGFDNYINGVSEIIETFVLDNSQKIVTQEFVGTINDTDFLRTDTVRAFFMFDGHQINTSEEMDDMFENFTGKVSGWCSVIVQ